MALPRATAADRSRSRLRVLIGLAVMWAVVPIFGQSVTVNVAGDALRVRAPGFTFIKGEPLARLKDGRAVQIDFSLSVLPKPGATAIAETRRGFVLSYDLWEERFAVTIVDPNHGRASPAISHLSSKDAEAWCLDHVTVATSALSSLTRDTPFWIKMSYQVRDGERAPATADDSGFSLRGLIDRLSRRTSADDLRDAIDAGPFRLPR